MSSQDPLNATLTGPVVSHDFSPPVRGRGRSRAVALFAFTGVLMGGAALQTDSEPFGDTLKQWQTQIARGLQVSLRAVADGRDHPASAPATVPTASVVARDVRPR